MASLLKLSSRSGTLQGWPGDLQSISQPQLQEFPSQPCWAKLLWLKNTEGLHFSRWFKQWRKTSFPSKSITIINSRRKNCFLYTSRCSASLVHRGPVGLSFLEEVAIPSHTFQSHQASKGISPGTANLPGSFSGLLNRTGLSKPCAPQQETRGAVGIDSLGSSDFVWSTQGIWLSSWGQDSLGKAQVASAEHREAANPPLLSSWLVGILPEGFPDPLILSSPHLLQCSSWKASPHLPASAVSGTARSVSLSALQKWASS